MGGRGVVGRGAVVRGQGGSVVVVPGSVVGGTRVVVVVVDSLGSRGGRHPSSLACAAVVDIDAAARAATPSTAHGALLLICMLTKPIDHAAWGLRHGA